MSLAERGNEKGGRSVRWRDWRDRLGGRTMRGKRGNDDAGRRGEEGDRRWRLWRSPAMETREGDSNPNEFQPERFLTSHKDIDVKGKHYELLPFGSDRRTCPGVFLALQTFPLILAGLIQQFALRKPSNELVDMSEGSGLTTNKALPFEVLLAPRLSHSMYHIGA
ncbi:cytochrome P450 [Cynara cardunculus var. scolymus]|uniref:Cytochrome P450 n=1 Tax=Cynara cardunculus var. scolymus TaxID=59895 RepID=A0A103YCK8_CYNCS|nr:cytochrome P450 [Cynara cardunculus var. scolymus]